MTEQELFTRCPTCRTVFRTNDSQLSILGGKVRCGQCRMVFDGRAQLIDLRQGSRESAVPDALGPPTVTLRESMALNPVSGQGVLPTDVAATTAGATPALAVHAASADEAPADDSPPPPGVSGGPRVPPDEDVVPYEWHKEEPRERRPGVQWALGVLSMLLVAALGAQAVFHFRDAIAARYPEWRPALLQGCAVVGCTIQPLRAREDVTIESHDLQSDPAHQGLLILQLTLRNRAAFAVAFPHLELEILDLGGERVVRRAFTPAEYAGGAADFSRGMPAGAEWNVKLFLDASGVSARGYNLDLFYP